MQIGWPKFLTPMWRRPKDWGGDPFYVFHSSKYGTWDDKNYLESYNCIPEVNAVVNLKANAFSNGVYKVVDGKAKEYPDEPILNLLNNPNWFQGKGEFMKQTKIGHEVFGNEFLFFLTPVGFNFDVSRVQALYTIMSDMMTVEYDEDIPFFLFSNKQPPKVKYTYEDGYGTDKELPTQNIIHYNDNRIGGCKPNDKKILRGDSKLRALTPVINNLRACYESRGVIIVQRGANGAWVNNTGKDGNGGVIPLRRRFIEKLQQAFSRYGTMHNQNQFIISPRDIRFEQAGNFKPKDLGLFDETYEGFRKIQDAYGTPAELFARPDGTTYENQNQARKGLYVETVIPEAVAYTNGISSKVYPNGDKRIVLDYTHLEIFQDDIKLKAEKNKALIENLSLLLSDGMISDEEYRAEIFKLGYGNGKPLPKPEPAPVTPTTEADSTQQDGNSEDEQQ